MEYQAELLRDKIEHYINELIDNNRIKPGDKLPSERQLAGRFNTSNMPVRQALQGLVEKGMLRKEHGRGNFLQKLELKDKKTNQLAFMYCLSRNSLFNNPFSAPIFGGIDLAAQVQDKSILLQGLDPQYQKDPIKVIYDTADRVDGILLFSPYPSVFEKIKNTIRILPRPVVVVNYENVPNDIDSVLFDTTANVKSIVQFLAELGHRQIGCLCFQGYIRHFERQNSNIYKRVITFKEGMAECGLCPDPDHIQEEFDINDIDTFKKMMSGPSAPTALFCTNDHLALSVCEMAKRLGISVPDDLTIIGYDGIRDGQISQPPLTTIELPLPEMGREAVSRLMEKKAEMEQGRKRNLRVALPGSLVERGSHKKMELK